MVEADSERAKAEELQLMKGGRETVLIAEDDKEVMSFSREVLERYGYRVIEAVDGEDAVEKFADHEHTIDMLLLDVVMPKKNGREVLEVIRKLRPDVKALFISGYAPGSIHNKGILEEGIHYVSKPISIEGLLRRVREVLDQKAG